ncbi:MAG: DUF305 domain-containing protein [Anaerolineae bacterium]|jgi:uncharacterized protein (DUF305 family)|nr:DUF305 domain-containing protein [Anaerolineae bacterium]
MKKLLLVVVLLLLSAPLTLAMGAAEGRAGRAEVRFLQGMIDHHHMALMMANDCLAKEDLSADMVTLCAAVIAAQTPEIDMMRGWLADWYAIDYAPMDMDTMPGMGGGMNHGGMGGMRQDPPGMMGMMAGFADAEGTEYEILWLEAMIDHHDDAVHMSARVLRWAAHPDLIDLAKQIIRDQTAEIARMEIMLTERDAS